MKKTLLILLFFVPFGIYTNAQTTEIIAPSDLDNAIQNNDSKILEVIAIFNDAIDAPTKYNAYVSPFMADKSFPVKQNHTKKEYDSLLEDWISKNPETINKLFEARQEAHDKLYGPRKK